PARSGSTAAPTDAARCGCICSRWPTWRCCSVRWSPTRSCSLRRVDGPPPRQEEHPHRTDRRGDLHVHVRADLRGRGGVHLVSPLEPEVPPTGEEVHLPGPTILPLLTAAGITIA